MKVATKKIYFEDVNVGDSIPELVKPPVNESQLVMYAGASGDFNPLHTVHAFGEKAGFGGVIAHGMLSMGFVGQVMTDWVGNEALAKLSVNFRAITKPKDVITCKGKITKKYSEGGKNLIDVDLLAENQRGEKTIVGQATAALPSKS